MIASLLEKMMRFFLIQIWELSFLTNKNFFSKKNNLKKVFGAFLAQQRLDNGVLSKILRFRYKN